MVNSENFSIHKLIGLVRFSAIQIIIASFRPRIACQTYWVPAAGEKSPAAYQVGDFSPYLFSYSKAENHTGFEMTGQYQYGFPLIYLTLPI